MFFRLLLIFKRFVTRRTLSKLFLLSLLSFSFVASATALTKETPKILVYGDSLSAAYGLPQPQGWVSLLKKKLSAQGYHYTVINASISGETTSGGLTRLAITLANTKPSIIILELGANDGLRGLPLNEMKNNLSVMIDQCNKAKVRVLLVGMQIPPNYGPKYTDTFRQTYRELSQQHTVSLVPFMLENIAAKPHLIQNDGLHPNALGQPLILNNIWPTLSTLLRK